MGRKVILDNSAYELGKPYDEVAYRMWIRDLRPTEYILPDYRDDSRANRLAVYDWCQKNKDLPGRKIGVVHGSSFEDYCKNYQDIKNVVDKLAFSVESFFFDDIEKKNVDPQLARVRVLKKMVEKGVIDEEMDHHILGALSPTEYTHFIDYRWIETVDTSNPVLHGMLEQQYEGLEGLKKKSKIKLDSLIFSEITERQRVIIDYNVKWFRENLRSYFYKGEPLQTEAPIYSHKVEVKEGEVYNETVGSHYRKQPIEAIEVIRRVYGEEKAAIWSEITAFKYRLRLGLKDSQTIDSDLVKENYYLEKSKEFKTMIPQPGK